MNQPQSRSLGFLLVDAARLMRRRFEQESRDLDMTSAQLQIIARLSKDEGISQAALAALLGLEPMTLSRHVDRMVAGGLIERREDRNDRRARRLFTTAKSRALMEPMRERARLVFESAQEGLSPEAREQLLDALETVVRNLSDKDAAPLQRRGHQLAPAGEHA